MNLSNPVNVITVIMVALFLAPIFVAIIRPFRDEQLERFVGSLLNNIIILISIICSFYLTGFIRSENGNKFLVGIYKALPSLQGLVTSKNIWIYAILVFLLTLLITGLLHLLIMPLHTYILAPAINKLASALRKKGGVVRRTVWGLCQLPRSIVYVLVFSLLLNFYTNYNGSPAAEEAINQSVTYQLVNKNVLDPLFSSSIVKNIPVLLDDSFKDASESLRNTHLIRYFNGMTLNDAIKSNAEIDSTAKKIVGKESSSRQKAYLLYKWVCENISYDDSKAAAVATNPASISSGAIVAYNTKTGICFDYSCLYIAMCRAVDVKVRFITGLGFSGVDWGDHAWNQIYSSEEKRWINVDTTFGHSGKNYFDRADFSVDHQNAVVQGEW